MKINKILLYAGFILVSWAMFVLTVIFMVCLISALIKYLNWEVLLIGIPGIIATLAILIGSFGMGIFIVGKFLVVCEEVGIKLGIKSFKDR